jgi:hypothetical protein
VSTDYSVAGRSDAEVRNLAKGLLVCVGAHKREPVNVLAILERDELPTAFGLKRLHFNIVADDALGGNDALTTFDAGCITVSVTRSVHLQAKMGVGRARMTLAHELGHAVMHEGPPMARAAGARGLSPHRWIRSFESAEHQAKVFGAALLINNVTGEDVDSAEQASVRFGISLEAAEIYYAELVALRERPLIAERIQRQADEFRMSVAKANQPKQYLDGGCVQCGAHTLMPVGIKFLCETCGRIGDLADGDEAA